MHSPTRYHLTDVDEIKRLIRKNPWATLVSDTDNGLVASHYPVLLDDAADGIVLVGHFGLGDAREHDLGEHEILVIIQGAHGYVSSSWYERQDIVPTWNHLTAHLYGTPQILTDEENYATLSRLTEHFEGGMPGGHSLAEDEEGTRRLARGTRGYRLEVTRFDARAKLSQNKSEPVQERIVEGLAATYPDLAEEMRRSRSAREN
ncbi:FMN-binding negative transcriptional regulator [Demequina sp. NBRC 110054]|uniref:FMN-binding negative transcriptional regulator n=1 Tax=Demequina sp. NBRC 110054 TaxID=1570343 RepID=UPI000A005174|nr:FMN-binding negative transcriptional regulator [Demequina sp. NBRC 110054]